MLDRLVVHRSEWMRGRGATNERLYRSGESKFCIVGLYLRDILHVIPSILDNAFRSIDVGFGNSFKPNLETELMEINGAQFLTDIQRENELKLSFAKMDVELEFVD